jgi:hypothetical protein
VGAALRERAKGGRRPKGRHGQMITKRTQTSLLPHMAMLPSGARRPNLLMAN